MTKVTRPVTLLIPPVGDATMPMLGPYVLARYLRSRGIECAVCDIGMEILRAAASPAVLRTAYSTTSYTPSHLAAVAAAGIEALARPHNDVMSLSAGLKLYSALYGTFSLCVDDLVVPFSITTIPDLQVAVGVVAPIVELARATVGFEVATSRPGAVVGFSVSFPSQLVLALAIAEAVKRRQSDAIVLLGGAYFDSLGFRPQALTEAFSFVDAIVQGPGEASLERIARSPEPVRRRYATLGSAPKDQPPRRDAVPDFSDVRWNLYLSGSRAIPISLGGPCYYGQCRFCSGDRSVRSSSVSPQRVASIARTLGAQSLYIVDAAVPPAELLRLASVFNGRVRWVANARPTMRLTAGGVLGALHDGGCWMLRFGFESGSQRVLDAMRKGTRVSEVSGVVKAAKAFGIKVHLYVMLGYPGEQEADREDTLTFLADHREHVYSYSVSMFQPIPGTPVYLDLCSRLGLHAEDQQDAVAAINAHLYPDEDRFAHLTRTIQRISLALSGCHTNRWCYSGRVFLEEPVSSRGCIQPVRLTRDCPEPSAWSGHFGTVLAVAPRGAQRAVHRLALVDLVNDRVVTCDMKGDGADRAIGELVERFLNDGDEEGLARALEPTYAVRRVRAAPCPEQALQYAPPLPTNSRREQY